MALKDHGDHAMVAPLARAFSVVLDTDHGEVVVEGVRVIGIPFADAASARDACREAGQWHVASFRAVLQGELVRDELEPGPPDRGVH